MTTETKHTVTPWDYHVGEDYVEIFGASKKDDGSVAFIRSASKRTQANAAFIVRAVNAHDELVAALGVVIQSTEYSCMLPEEQDQIIAALRHARRRA